MSNKEHLLDRLNAIGDSLGATGQALALLGLGSVGVETDRLDAFSDLDFFAIVKPGNKGRFLNSLDWLELAGPLVYFFQNTVDGYKALYQDGIFCEFAVFEPHELSAIPFANGRIVWKEPGFDESICVPRFQQRTEQSVEMLLGEALTNLYVGLGRYHRGEKFSGVRLVQGHAVDRVVELTAHIKKAASFPKDSFDPQRRYELRYPEMASRLPEFMQGYDRNIQSAKAILAFLEQHFEINAAIREAILGRCDYRI